MCSLDLQVLLILILRACAEDTALVDGLVDRMLTVPLLRASNEDSTILRKASSRSTSASPSRRLRDGGDQAGNSEGADRGESESDDDGPMDVWTAYKVLGLEQKDSSPEKEQVKAAYRRMAMKWHPDKNRDKEAKATRKFKRVAAAYHTLTVTNFDYEAWARNFCIPPLQTLLDVFEMAIKGKDPLEIEAIMRARGEYRPHPLFGVDPYINWNAGTRPKPSWETPDASRYTRTRKLEGWSCSGMLESPKAKRYYLKSNPSVRVDSIGSIAEEKQHLWGDDGEDEEDTKYGEPQAAPAPKRYYLKSNPAVRVDSIEAVAADKRHLWGDDLE